MTNNRAIIFVHSGNQDYFKIVIKQALYTNPNERIIIIGDKSNAHYKGVEHYLISDYSKQFKDFEKYYEHLSYLPKWFELICFQRWFCMAEIMNKFGIDEIWANDSDNLIYSPYDHARPKGAWDYALCIKSSQSCSGAISFWKKETINSFCLHLIQTYQNDIGILRNRWYKYKSKHSNGGICDMTLLQLFRQKESNYILLNILNIVNRSTIDAMITNSENAQGDIFEMSGELKKILIKDDKAYGFLENNKIEPIQFHSLQFQGGSKKYIHYFSAVKISPIFKLKKDIYLKINLLVNNILRLLNGH